MLVPIIKVNNKLKRGSQVHFLSKVSSDAQSKLFVREGIEKGRRTSLRAR